jgi:hypothetical protein
MMMKRSNMMLAGAGAVLVVLLLAGVITARVLFDRTIIHSPSDSMVVRVETRY